MIDKKPDLGSMIAKNPRSIAEIFIPDITELYQIALNDTLTHTELFPDDTSSTGSKEMWLPCDDRQSKRYKFLTGLTPTEMPVDEAMENLRRSYNTWRNLTYEDKVQKAIELLPDY